MKKTIISLSILFKVLTAQAVPGETQVAASSISGLAGGLFDSEKLRIQQGFTLGTALMGNQSVSYGMLTNNFQLEVNPELKVTGSVHLLQRSQSLPGQFQSLNPNLLYDVSIQYQPWKNTWFKVSLANYGRFQNGMGNLPIQ